jgi:sugar O-acyltransferase (sialic acid O-acetyltransferase NeuD family)
MKKRICIIGAGGFAKEVFWLLSDLGLSDDIVSFLDVSPAENQRIYNVPVNPMSFFDTNLHSVTIGIASPNIRKKIVEEQLPSDTEYLTLVHPQARVYTALSNVGMGAIIFLGSIVSCDVKIGKFSQINFDCTIGHDCNLGDYFTAAPGVHLSGENILGNQVYIGTNAATKQQITICDDVFIGMSAAVIKSISIPGTYSGNPARQLPV